MTHSLVIDVRFLFNFISVLFTPIIFENRVNGFKRCLTNEIAQTTLSFILLHSLLHSLTIIVDICY